MRWSLLVPLVLVQVAVAGATLAAPTGTTPDPAKPAGPGYANPEGPRQGGDTIASAVPIGALPFHDTGTTAGYFNDYDEACPYGGSTSPDVVYSYVAGADICVDIDLCLSGYDTKVYVYANAAGNLGACNDDFAACSGLYRSRLEDVGLMGGNTYYVVVDGYGGDSGAYDLTVTQVTCMIPPGPCPADPPIDCPAGALPECEPACVDDYVDNYDGGCNSTGWVLVQGQNGTECATLCGKSCTYLFNGGSYRDTDWFECVVGGGGGVSAACIAEFDLLIFLIYGPIGGVLDCTNYTLLSAVGGPGVLTCIGHSIDPGATAWFWVGPSVFSGVPESRYTFTICGIEPGPTPSYSGACCAIVSGLCTVTSESACGAGSIYLGDCTYCSPNPCPPPVTGACCNAQGACLVMTPANCAFMGGTYLGDNTVCVSGLCEDPVPIKVTSWGLLKNQYR